MAGRSTARGGSEASRDEARGEARGEPESVVFVYGSLLHGEDNHGLLAGARFLGAARTVACYDLADLGAYPAMVPGGSVSVIGELYAVDAATLAELDDFEGHPSFYRRTRLRLADGSEAEAYLLPADRARDRPRLPEGDWRAAKRRSRRA